MYLYVYTELSSEKYEGNKKIYMDGLKQGIAVAAAAVAKGKVLVKRLPNHTSIFSAEATAIPLAIDIISQFPNDHFLVLSDSPSCLKSIEN
jgi:hypothetical protein